MDPDLIQLCLTTDLVDGEATLHIVDDIDIALFRVGDLFFAINDLCTHGPGSLSEGYLEGYTIECDVHNGSFDIRTGAVVSSPCVEPAQTYPVIVKDNKVYIQFSR